MRPVPWQPPPWTDTPVGRLLFLHELRGCGAPTKIVKPNRRHRGGFAVEVRVTPPGLPIQRVRIVFDRGAEVPVVHVDGQADSRHRYPDGSLCMWYPEDPPERRWVRRDRARVLLGHIIVHLLLGEWWRRAGEWVSDEVPHDTTDDRRTSDPSKSPVPGRSTARTSWESITATETAAGGVSAA